MNKIILNNTEYQIIDSNYDINQSEIESLYTEYFHPYDYILGDWAYSKLRLKGYYEKDNKNKNQFNNIESYKEYLKNNCAYGCKFFLIKKTK